MTTKLFEAIIQFFKYQTGWTLLFALSHVLFWTSTYPIMREYGYSDRKSPTGAYVSGQYGSGIVPRRRAECFKMKVIMRRPRDLRVATYLFIEIDVQ
eukprot:scaffold2929_cov145-Skeletonema_menzelii.AAC.3